MPRTLYRALAVLFLGGLIAWITLLIWNWRQAEDERHSTIGDKNYSLIEQKLYMGGLVPEPPPGTTAVLNLCEHADPYVCDVHKWAKIRDGAPAPTVEWLRKMVDFVMEQQRAGRVTYVHCQQGASRTGLVVVACIMAKHRWTRDQALEFVRSKRPETRPNPAFMELLREWERIVLTEEAVG